ncbi:MAG: ABC transporter ATP-binding protein [Roseburia sp.]|nr:ABC transporter ATP-binding protein [Roseburia sp.]MCM1098638.1 ABC transporter ATP-binding protein [Ruminococcus flavefaciens]
MIRAKVREIDVPAIEVLDVVKVYKLYDKPRDRVKEAFGFGKRQMYKPHYALNGVSMCIFRGETVGIIGTNGSGKSTILKIITGVLTPTSGTVNVDGRISALLELGAGFNQEYNGIENIYLNGTMMGFSEKEIDERLPDILEFADIGDYVYQPVKTYSSGMFVRLAFAVAINIDPEILIVDEALSVGDVFFQAKCYHKFEEFKKLGKTIVFVSHDLSSISKYCDRVFLLNKGTLLGEGSPKEMIDAYKRVLVGQYETPDEQESGGLLEDPQLRRAAGSGRGQKAGNPAENTAEGNADPAGGKGRGQKAGSPAGRNTDFADKGRKPWSVADGVERKNPDALEYGTGQARIEEYYVTDDRGVRTAAVIKGSEFTLHMRVKFLDSIPAPIFAFSVKNAIGTEITGTNTMIEKAFLESVEPGQEKDVTFTQRMSLQGGEYLLSLGVTGYNGDTFEVYHRLYDVLNITVISDKNTVGYYDMDSVVKVTDAR